jgi:hypothetical protein
MNNPKQFFLIPFETDHPTIEIIGNIQQDNRILTITYYIRGEVDKIDFDPPKSKGQRGNNLWEKTCLEFFVGVNNSPKYWEFNLSPSGDWNIYSFEGYREGMVQEERINDLDFLVELKPDIFTLGLTLDLTPMIPKDTETRLGITAVIKTIDRDFSYWALTHSGNQPDFHLGSSFII